MPITLADPLSVKLPLSLHFLTPVTVTSDEIYNEIDKNPSEGNSDTFLSTGTPTSTTSSSNTPARVIPASSASPAVASSSNTPTSTVSLVVASSLNALASTASLAVASSLNAPASTASPVVTSSSNTPTSAVSPAVASSSNATALTVSPTVNSLITSPLAVPTTTAYSSSIPITIDDNAARITNALPTSAST